MNTKQQRITTDLNDFPHKRKLPTKSERLRLFGSVEPMHGNKPVRKEQMHDLQNTHNDFLFALEGVGIGNLHYPLVVQSLLAPEQMTVNACFQLTTSLPSTARGINMSRLTEQLEQARRRGLSDRLQELCALTVDLANAMNQQHSQLHVTYDWFYEQAAPMTALTGLNSAKVGLHIAYHDHDDRSTTIDHRDQRSFDIEASLQVQVTTLCPCSKEISEYSAHNQRGYVEFTITPIHNLPYDWKEQLLEAATSNASSLPYPVLKRPDEKHVTEQAYENPRFVEDMLRLTAADLYEKDWVQSFVIRCRNEESIHQHDAVGTVSYRRPDAMNNRNQQ
ncbi:GTP cyclohydrolase FolE2 [Paenibacillus sp. WLX2291]|uniref:GTP cyclohydrolase FolE2 n=1 Tax=Paenibacillus sp. WLX2291 TaxID=3296934 RepID=UPI00398409D2